MFGRKRETATTIPSFEQQDRSLAKEQLALEAKVGITEAMEKARAGRFIPLGIMGEKANFDEFVADEYGHYRKHARNAYFSSPDEELRTKLIKTQRRRDDIRRWMIREKIEMGERNLGIAEEKARSVWITYGGAAGLGALSVGLGYTNVGGLPGAIAGAVAGLFIGQGWIVRASGYLAREIAEAKSERDEAKKEKAADDLWPECFSEIEDEGNRGERLDHELALGNVYRAEAKKTE